MKTQNKILKFSKSNITELNDKYIKTVLGGSGYACSNCIPDPISDKIRTVIGGNNNHIQN